MVSAGMRSCGFCSSYPAFTNTPDRVFVKAITTIRALSSRSSYGLLPRPPAENRIKLYGLYKQATEGDVQGIMARPEGFTIEDEGAKKKWDAWKREEGLSKTQAKRSYILYLIDTMRIYASGAPEARELLSELEYLWDQIKDVTFSEEDQHFAAPYRFNVASLVVSNVDQSDRFSTGTPWPLQSNYSALVTNNQFNSNLERIYSHSRRNTQLSLSEFREPQRGSFRGSAKPARLTGAAPEVSASSLDEFKAWQGQINRMINHLSKEFAFRKSGANPVLSSDTESEGEPDARELMRRRVVAILKVVGLNALRVAKNLGMSLVALLFVIWFLNKNVIVQRTIVKKQLEGKKQKELVINMVINTSENKWFVRLLSLLNSFVGFV